MYRSTRPFGHEASNGAVLRLVRGDLCRHVVGKVVLSAGNAVHRAIQSVRKLLLCVYTFQRNDSESISCTDKKDNRGMLLAKAMKAGYRGRKVETGKRISIVHMKGLIIRYIYDGPAMLSCYRAFRTS